MSTITEYNEALEILNNATHAVGAVDDRSGYMIEVFFFPEEPTDENLDELFDTLSADADFMSRCDGFSLIEIPSDEFHEVHKVCMDSMLSQKQTYN